MASRDLINLGISPDSGTGDSARRGGEKINTLFADIYTQFGDNPVGQDPDQPFYGYRRPFFEYEYKVGELHPAGRFIPIKFKQTDSRTNLYDSQWGYGYDNSGAVIDADGDGIPDIYRDSEWYFLSRGEQIDADLSQMPAEGVAHFVLPIGVPGDQIIIRDAYGTWDSDKFINIWTTPFEFQSIAQITEWESATGVAGETIDSETISIFSPLDGTSYTSNWHKVKVPTAIETVYPRMDQPFALSRTTDPYQGLSPVYFQNIPRYQLEFLFTNYEDGWIVRQVALDAADVGATLLQFAQRLNAIDSDLDAGLYVSADSDVRHSVPIFRRTSGGNEIHGTLALRGDRDSLMTTIDSEDTLLQNDPRGPNGGTAQPLTTTVRIKLRDDVKVKNNVFVGNQLEVGHNMHVADAFFVDSDRMYFVDSDGRSILSLRSTFLPDTYNERIRQTEEYTLTMNGNTILGRDSDDLLIVNSRIASSLIPYGHEIYNLGDSDNAWNDLYLSGNTIHLGQIKIQEQNSTIVFRDSDDNLIDVYQKNSYMNNVAIDSDLTVGNDVEIFGTLDVGEHAQFDSDVSINGNVVIGDDVSISGKVYIRETLTIDSDVTINGNVAIDEDVAIDGSISIHGHSTFDSDVDIAGNVTIGDDLAISGKVSIRESLTVDSDVALSADLRVDSDVIIKGELTVGMQTFINDDLHVTGHVIMDSDLYVAQTIYANEFKTVNPSGVTYFNDDVQFNEHVVFDSEVEFNSPVAFGQEVIFEDDVVFLDNAIFDSDVSILGSLTVNGSINFVNSQNLAVSDTFITVNKGQATPFNDTGFIFTRFDSDNVSSVSYNSIFEWDETTDKFVFGETDSSGIASNPTVTKTYAYLGQGTFGLYDVSNTLRVANTYGAANTVTVTGSMTETTSGTKTETVSGGNAILNVTAGNYTVDASGDIVLSADGDTVTLNNGTGADSIVYQLGNTTSATVSGSFTEAVTTNYIQTVGGTSAVTVTGNATETYAGTKTETVTGNSTQNYSSNLITAVVGNVTYSLNGNSTETYGNAVTDAHTETYNGNLTTNVTGNTTENYTGNLSTNVGGTFSQGVTGNYTIDSGSDIVLSADGDTITLDNGAGGNTLVYQLGATTSATVSGSFTESVTTNYIQTVGGTSSVSVTGNATEAYSGTKTETVTGAVSQTYSSNLNTAVTGNVTYSLNGNSTETYGNAVTDSHTETYNGNLTTTVTGNTVETYTGSLSTTVGGNFTQGVTGDFTVDASGDIILDADGNDIIFKNGAGADTATWTFSDAAALQLNTPADLTLQSTATTGDVVLGNTTNDIVRVGQSAVATDSPFVFNFETAGDNAGKWVLTGDGTSVIDGGTF